MPYTKIWIHLIWSTKNRTKLITRELKPQLLSHIIENAKTKDIFIQEINCIDDHIHVLISLKRDQAVSKVVQLIKGESSNWLNKKSLIRTKFEWQDEYIAVSISHSMIDKAKNYIKNQEVHHKKKSFMDEYNEFIKNYGFEVINDN